MDIAEAFEIVLELAYQNIIDKQENPDEYNRQLLACNMIEDLAVNEFGED